ncbi:MAG: hypothetical protein OEZ20_04015 [candidate division WOR-3 bacterium]|nr:hypothetical protein [candidate division WOR-3 bacterium]MDH5683612.1 hypothetical protein [candidate division WOR-3 bacterium]
MQSIKNITTATVVTILCLISLIGAQEKGKENQKGYRIEADVFPIGNDQFLVKPSVKEIKFVSPEGKIIRTLPFDYMRDCRKIIISPTFTYLLKAEDTPGQLRKDSLGQMEQIKEARVEFSYINAKGEKKWKKNFEIIFTLAERDEDDYAPYFIVISKDGSRIVFVKNSIVSYSDLRSDIIVFDTLGKEVASVYNTYGIYSMAYLKISPDGKIIAAEPVMSRELREGYRGSYLFFLDVESERTKVVKAEGDGWHADGFPLKNNRIQLTLQEYPKSFILSFDELPDDLSVLFKQGGER